METFPEALVDGGKGFPEDYKIFPEAAFAFFRKMIPEFPEKGYLFGREKGETVFEGFAFAQVREEGGGVDQEFVDLIEVIEESLPPVVKAVEGFGGTSFGGVALVELHQESEVVGEAAGRIGLFYQLLDALAGRMPERLLQEAGKALRKEKMGTLVRENQGQLRELLAVALVQALCNGVKEGKHFFNVLM
jgi:hypothetical protein